MRIQRKPVETSVTSSLKNLEIYTAPRQQCVVELEDGTKLRMNAQSRLSYPLLKRDSTVVYMKGEAYVDANKRYGSAPLIIGNEKGKVMANRADFLIRSDKNETKTMLNDGKLEVYSHRLNKTLYIVCSGDFVYIGVKCVGENQLPRDTMSYVANQDFNEAKMWTRKICVYKDISLRAFVD